MNIVIVESAAKAKTINKYLGSDYKVIASYGHVRDLPSKDGAVEPDEDFRMHWDTDARSAKILKEITQAVKGADKLILATDPDREGEAISWHILQVLEQKKVLKNVAVERVAFNAVTKQAIFDALRSPREIDSPLVSAYLARRALDYLVGFTLSPVLWRKLPGSRSAGRVQSVALRLICQRELEIEVFKSQEYWSITSQLAKASGETFLARLHTAEGKKLGKFDIPDEETATRLKKAIEGAPHKVSSVESKPQKRHPYAPFTTSTLQQEASRKLGFGAKRTMQVAQKLYEGVDIGGETQGLITYMRTDGVQIVPEAVQSCRSVVKKLFGEEFLPAKPRIYKSKAKNAQEAHEAVRPTDLARLPKNIASSLNADEAKLYRLIWQRTIASQMESAEFLRTTADIEVEGTDGKAYGVRSTGSVLKFEGFLKLYEEGRDDSSDDGDDKRLPMLERGEDVNSGKVESKQHFTEPPPRYTEATIVKRMEELGIGRPSTYASTLSVLEDRGYVQLEQKRLIPEDKGRLVTAFLESFFERYVQYDFTAGLEEQLDLISDGKLLWQQVLHDFWNDFTKNVEDISELKITDVLDALNDVLGPHIFPDKGDGKDPRQCPSCDEGKLSLKVSGKFGAFIGCTQYPDCKYTRQLSSNGNEDTLAIPSEGKSMGQDPESGLEITLKNGRFGPYLQMEAASEDDKPRNISIPKGYDVNEMTPEYAVKLAALPRVVGKHPETGKDITAGFGRYGPFVLHERTYANLESAEEVFTVGINRAVTLIAEKQKSGKGAAKAAPLRELGEHPELGGPMEVMDGRYGPYIKHGKINATIPKSSDPEKITVEEAVALIAAKAEKSGKGKTKAKTATKKATTKKAPAKKAAAKKATTKTTAKKTATKKTAAKKTTKKTATAEGEEKKTKSTPKTATKKTGSTTKKAAST
ncbi:MAG: type I DNA topoisomerase [Methyloligellaceae bacterium]